MARGAPGDRDSPHTKHGLGVLPNPVQVHGCSCRERRAVKRTDNTSPVSRQEPTETDPAP